MPTALPPLCNLTATLKYNRNRNTNIATHMLRNAIRINDERLTILFRPDLLSLTLEMPCHSKLMRVHKCTQPLFVRRTLFRLCPSDIIYRISAMGIRIVSRETHINIPSWLFDSYRLWHPWTILAESKVPALLPTGFVASHSLPALRSITLPPACTTWNRKSATSNPRCLLLFLIRLHWGVVCIKRLMQCAIGQYRNRF